MASTESMRAVVCACVGPFTKIWTGTIDSLEKARTHAQMKVFAVKIAIVTSDTLGVDRLRLRKKKQKKKQKHEQIEGWVVFCR